MSTQVASLTGRSSPFTFPRFSLTPFVPNRVRSEPRTRQAIWRAVTCSGYDSQRDSIADDADELYRQLYEQVETEVVVARALLERLTATWHGAGGFRFDIYK